jgi:1,4-alpha-glucan branching enzyme
MNSLEEKYGWLSSPQVMQLSTISQSAFSDAPSPYQANVSLKNENDKMLIFKRAGLLFVFNFHPVQSYTDYRVGIEAAGEDHVALSSDEKRFGGFEWTKPFHDTHRMEWEEELCICHREPALFSQRTRSIERNS